MNIIKHTSSNTFIHFRSLIEIKNVQTFKNQTQTVIWIQTNNFIHRRWWHSRRYQSTHLPTQTIPFIQIRKSIMSTYLPRWLHRPWWAQHPHLRIHFRPQRHPRRSLSSRQSWLLQSKCFRLHHQQRKQSQIHPITCFSMFSISQSTTFLLCSISQHRLFTWSSEPSSQWYHWSKPSTFIFQWPPANELHLYPWL